METLENHVYISTKIGSFGSNIRQHISGSSKSSDCGCNRFCQPCINIVSSWAEKKQLSTEFFCSVTTLGLHYKFVDTIPFGQLIRGESEQRHN